MKLNFSFKKLNFWGDGHPFGFGLSPEADWRVILIITIFLGVLVSGINVLMFTKVNKGVNVEGNGTTTETPALNIEELKKVTSYYQEKALRFEEIKAGGERSVDPSN